MIYQILNPLEPLDPRQAKIDSLMRLYEIMPSLVECDLEEEAVREVHDRYASAVAMPVPVPIGSGEVFLLGILADVRDAPNLKEIRFPLFVHAVAETARDRKLVKERNQFSRRAWRTPVRCPTKEARTFKVEVRASDLETPMFVDATVGEIAGRLILHCEIGGIAMSVHFEDPAVHLIQYQR